MQEQGQSKERYTCTQLRAMKIELGAACCAYCHKWNGKFHEGEEDQSEEDVLTYIVTPAGRLIGLCHMVYDYTPVSETNQKANAWLDEAIEQGEKDR